MVLFFSLGLMMSGSVVTGDSLGRVNLLYFIGLFVLWPLISCLMLVVSSILPNAPSVNILPWLLKLPVIPVSQRDLLINLKKQQRFKPWLLLVTQQSVLAFSLGCLLSFFAVLLFSDVAFVWRSTLLSPEHIQGLLAVIALPWAWLESAQPALELVQVTQENRMTSSSPTIDYGAWWLFLFMAQITYAIMPRLLSTLMARYHFNRLPDFTTDFKSNQPLNKQPAAPNLASVSHQKPLQQPYNLCCWLQLSPVLIDKVLVNHLQQPQHVYQVGFHGQDEALALSDELPQLLLVAAWEPPMGELQDYLEQGHGVIQLLDHKEGVWQDIAPHYVDEWRRFCLNLDNWTLFIDKELI